MKGTISVLSRTMKGTISVLSLSTWLPLVVPLPELLKGVSKAERKTFPRNEAMAFESELRKPNFELILIVKDMVGKNLPVLVAYVAISRTKGKALLHKVCVLEEFRRQGIAIRVLQMQIEKLKAQGCEIIQLWVDVHREPANHLYCQLGFVEVHIVEDYYAPSRVGMKMELCLV